MALSKTVTGDNGAVKGSYHRISMIVDDYDKRQRHVYIRHYADKSYRDQEKADIQENATKIARYNELIAKETLTDEEQLELDNLNIMELNAFIPTPRNLPPDTKITVDIDADYRADIYELIGDEFEDYSGATNI